jgi:aminopeptidase N
MKKICLLLLLGFGAAGAFAQNFDLLETIAETEKARRLSQQQAAQNRDFQNSADNRSDIRYCRMVWTVDPAVRYIAGEVTTVFEPSEAVQSLEFDFSSALTMDSIRYRGQNLSFSRNENLLTVQFPAALPPFLRDTITFYYQGVPTSTGFGSFELNNHNGSPVMWTLSEPYGAMEWWPCKQALNDKIDSVDIFVRCPEAYSAASNGLLMSETVAGGWKKAHWKHRYPIPAYLIAIAVTDYVKFTVPVPVGDDTIPMLNYVYQESLAFAEEGADMNVQHMQLFCQLFGEYPFKTEKYGHAQFSWGGGMEHQTMSFVGSFAFDLLSHELAHQWFGDKITCASWEDIWLNEGFATYLNGLCYERILPQYWELYKTDRISKATAQPDGSVWVDDTTSVSRVFSSRLSYSKGAMVLHMLRWVCGDSAFFAGVRNYINDPALVYGYARTDDLIYHLETASGRDLDGFFSDWFYGQGYPSYDIKWAKLPGNQIRITVWQTPSHPSVPFFDMPLPMKLSDGANDTLIVLQHTANAQVFTVTPGFVPDGLVFDPDQWILSRNNLVEEVLETGEPLPESSIEILPNPAAGDLVVRLKTPESENAEWTLWASDGKLVLQQAIELQSGFNDIPVPAAHLPAGRYVFQLKTNRWRVERPIILH